MLKKLLLFAIIIVIGVQGFAQETYLDAEADDVEKTYLGGKSYDVKTFTQKFKSEKPKNIIFLIGDGMGVSHVFSGLTANKGRLFLENCKYIGFSKTQSSDNYITDSAAGGTALSTGVRTYNGGIGVDPDKTR